MPHPLFLGLLTVLVISGCASWPPVQIIDRTSQQETSVQSIEEPPVVQPKVVEPEKPRVVLVLQTPTAAVRRPANIATQQLLAAVDSDMQQQNYAAAAARIERALRINPEDASAWHKLAQLQFNQNDYGQAKATAHRSNALPTVSVRTTVANWLLIADIERAIGDNLTAEKAYATARSHLNGEFDVDDGK